MKKTNIAKRIVSIVLAMSIVLSFALVSVSAAVPKGATVDESRTKTNGFETGRMFTSAAPKDHYALSTDVARTGDKSVKIQTKDQTAVYTDLNNLNTAVYYINTNSSWYPYECSSSYYYSITMYAYTTGSADISLHTYDTDQQGEAFHISGGTWQELSWVFKTRGSNLFYIAVENAVGSDVYFDDFEFKEITAVAACELAQDSFTFDYESQDSAVIEYTATVDLKSATIEAPEGVTANATVAGDKLTVELSGVAIGGAYDLTISAVDAYNRTTAIEKSVTMPGALPISIASSSIADGATDVVAPVGVVYVDAEEAIDAATLGGIAIVGENATVTGATLKDADTIRVELSGVLPLESYTLKFDGVASVDGGLLNDSIDFTTAAGDSYALDFEAGIPSQFVWTNLGSGSCNLSDNAYTGDQSVELLAASLSMGYASFKLNGIKPNTAYRVSFYYSSQYWGGDITSQSGNGTWTNKVITDTEKTGWKKITVDYTSDEESTQASVQLYNFFAKGANPSCVDTVYIDDIKLQEIGTVGQPVMVNNGRYVSELGLGTTTVEIPVANANAKAYIVSYDAQGRMTAFVPAVAENGVINLEWTANTPAYRTQIIVMDATTFAPLCDAFVYTMED